MKAAPEGVAMFELSPADEESMQFYRCNADSWARLADDASVRRFSEFTRNELRVMIGSEGAYLVEVLARIKNYSDEVNLHSLDRAVSRRLRTKGLALPKGKRTRPGIRGIVGDLTRVLLYFGIPMASSERSKLVIALRAIADEIGIRGDPRDELRRLLRAKRANGTPNGRRLLLDAFAQGIAPD